jgi:SPP1 family phage portal protein
VFGIPVKLKSYALDDAGKKLASMVQRTWDDNKLDYLNRKLARIVFSECEAAELWYLIDDSTFWQSLWAKIKSVVTGSVSAKFKVKVRLLSASMGDTLYPHFDEYGDMDAFSREYSLLDENGKPVPHFDVYTAEQIVKYVKDGAWVEVDRTANPFQKIPIIYYTQDYPEWYEVQNIIERFETLLSNFADTNDYFGSPMVKVTGKVLGFAAKGEQGKVLQLEKDANAEYLSWEQAPEAIKLELETLEKLIYSLTQTPNISFENMKNMGDVSGVALKLKFMDAHLKAENKIELFGEMFQRRLNLLKSVLGNVVDASLSAQVLTLEIEPVFTPYMPKNTKEEINILSVATGGKPVMSVKTALENNPLVGDIDEELKRLDEEANADTTRMQQSILGTSTL